MLADDWQVTDMCKSPFHSDTDHHVGPCHADERSLIVHGVNDRGNMNKGWDHIALLIEEHKDDPNVIVMSLDELTQNFKAVMLWKYLGEPKPIGQWSHP